jgi:hypothetical protein
VIAFDEVAAWRLEQKGYGVEEWLRTLLHHSERVDPATGRGEATWRQRPEASPSGAWFMRLSLIVREDGTGWTRMDNLNLRGGSYLAPTDQTPHAGLLLDLGLPLTAVTALPGRRVGEICDMAPVADAVMTAAYQTQGVTGPMVVVSFDPIIREVETPFFLLP